jgi:hypothetical protein
MPGAASGEHGQKAVVMKVAARESSLQSAGTAPSVTRALAAIRRYGAAPEQIDQAILAAINVTLCLFSGGDDRVAEGFNHDIAANGRGWKAAFGC